MAQCVALEAPLTLRVLFSLQLTLADGSSVTQTSSTVRYLVITPRCSCPPPPAACVTWLSPLTQVWMPAAIRSVRAAALCRVSPAREFELLPLWFFVVELVAHEARLLELCTHYVLPATHYPLPTNHLLPTTTYHLGVAARVLGGYLLLTTYYLLLPTTYLGVAARVLGGSRGAAVLLQGGPVRLWPHRGCRLLLGEPGPRRPSAAADGRYAARTPTPNPNP